MKFLNKLFNNSKSKASSVEAKNPDNTKLVFLIETWWQNRSDLNYIAVVNEILEGNSFLILPSVNDSNDTIGWRTAEAGSTLKLTSVFNLDGLQVLGAFTSTENLLEWKKEKTEYTKMRSKDVVEFCKLNNIDRMVINSNQKDMFVLERNRENIKTTVIEQETKVLVGTALKPLKKAIIDKLIFYFRKVDTIQEAYQYAQTLNGEVSIVLGIKMSVVSDNSRAALHNALNNALSEENLELPLDVMVIETEDWLKIIRNIQNSLFYTK